MRSGLRTRVFMASVAVVLLTLILGGALVGDAVRGNFSRFARAEARDQAYDLGVYLESWLNRSENQDRPGPALQDFFAGDVPDFRPYSTEDLDGPKWGDWTALAANSLRMKESDLVARLALQSMEEICDETDFSTESLLAIIMRYEMNALEQEGYAEADAVDELGGILFEVHTFLYDGPAEQALQIDAYENALPERLNWFLDTLVDDAQILAVDPNGKVLFDSSGGSLGVQVPEPLFDAATAIYDWRDGSELCEIIVAAGPGHYRAEANFFLQRVKRSLTTSALLLLGAALLLSWWLGRRLLAPIQALTDASARLAKGDSDGRLPVGSEDEVGRMSASFNHMLESLEEQRELRKRLVADLAHELNTPLSVIQLELAGLDAGMQSAKECAERIGVELEVLKRLANDVRILADSDRGALELRLEPCDVQACCHETVQRWQPRAAEKNIQLEFLDGPSFPPVQADRVRVMQVLGNLLSNAVRHSDIHGNVQVDAQVTSDANGESFLQVSVQDNGEGIPAQQIPTIFERFTRADSSRNRESAGRGLGLAIVADLVQRHGGRVWVESEIGTGSTFYFTLPL
ncbi:MAG: HAMP domain-containing sensor histidine kinase [Planctomycetota bacterium]